MKKLIRKARHSGNDPWLAILDHRNTPSQGVNASPAQRLMNRRPKTVLPTKGNLLMPTVVFDVKNNIQKEKNRQTKYYNRSVKDLPVLSENDNVRIQPLNKTEKSWRKGQIVEKVNDRSYKIKTEHGPNIRRNRIHLRKSMENIEMNNDFDLIVSEPTMQNQDVVDETEPSTEVTVPKSPIPTVTKNNSDNVSRSGRTIKLPTYLQDYVR